MSALAGLFRPGGFTYRTVPDLIDLLPKGMQHAATVAWKCCMRFLARGELDERATDLKMAEDSGWSASLIQKGLHALDTVLPGLDAATPDGARPEALIERRRAHGRRTIVPKPLAGRGTPLSVPILAPPAPPLPEKRERETATTDAGPSSSLESTAEKTGSGEYPSPELIDRALKLVPKATVGRVVDAVATYGSEWLARVLDRIEQRNAKPGNRRVESWGFVLTTLGNWKKEGGPPPVAPPLTAPVRPAPVASPEAPQRLTAGELADLVAGCQTGPPAAVKLNRIALRRAVESGDVPPELVATIPPELLRRE